MAARLDAAIRSLRRNDTITAEEILAHLIEEVRAVEREAPSDPAEDRA